MRWILCMIIINGTACHIPGIVLVYGGSNAHNKVPYTSHIHLFNKIQLCVFYVQAGIISGLYFYKVCGLLRTASTLRGKKSRVLLRHLLYLNIMVEAMSTYHHDMHFNQSIANLGPYL
jgi:hypothetical protein